MLVEQLVQVTRQARVIQTSEVSGSTKNIWISLHGYGENVFDFAEEFKVLDPAENAVFVPEALSRFYQKGFYGKVGASWMCSSNREAEIEDYCTYLYRVFELMIEPKLNPNTRLFLLGFSQGVATAGRFLMHSKIPFDQVIFWAGGIPKEQEFQSFIEQQKELNVLAVLGEKDQFFSMESFTKRNAPIFDLPKFKLHQFDGRHRLDRELLKKIAEAT